MREVLEAPERQLGRPGWNRGLKFPPEVITPEEVEALMTAFNQGATGARNRALVALLYRSGLRLAEALALLPKDIDHKVGAVHVLRGKGHKRRTAPIDAGGLLLVERWEAQRKALGLTARQPLLCQLSGARWRPQDARSAITYAARKAGLVRRIHPHIFRHAFAFELLQEGEQLPTIQRALGHSHISTTYRYVNHFAPIDVIAIGRGRPWALAAAEGAVP